MDIGKRHEDPWPETKDIITHGTAGYMSISIFVPVPKSHGDDADGPSHVPEYRVACITERNPELGKAKSFILDSKHEAYCSRGRLYFPRLLIIQTSLKRESVTKCREGLCTGGMRDPLSKVNRHY